MHRLLISNQPFIYHTNFDKLTLCGDDGGRGKVGWCRFRCRHINDNNDDDGSGGGGGGGDTFIPLLRCVSLLFYNVIHFVTTI